MNNSTSYILIVFFSKHCRELPPGKDETLFAREELFFMRVRKQTDAGGKCIGLCALNVISVSAHPSR